MLEVSPQFTYLTGMAGKYFAKAEVSAQMDCIIYAGTNWLKLSGGCRRRLV